MRVFLKNSLKRFFGAISLIVLSYLGFGRGIGVFFGVLRGSEGFCRAPLPAKWIFRRLFSLHAWILQGLLSWILQWISLWIFCPSFKGMDGPKKSTENIHTKVHDKINALRMKMYHDECSAEGQSWGYVICRVRKRSQYLGSKLRIQR